MRTGNQLFVKYGKATSQLDYAVKWLSANPSARLVTLDIGGNDLALCAADVTCATGFPATFQTFGGNLASILAQLRGTGYSGPLILLNYFAFNYADPLQVGAFTYLNGTISYFAGIYGAKVADSFTAFRLASARFNGNVCSTGLLLKLPDGTCDTHPSLAGQALLAGTVLAAK